MLRNQAAPQIQAIGCAKCIARRVTSTAVSKPCYKVGTAVPFGIFVGLRRKISGFEIQRTPNRQRSLRLKRKLQSMALVGLFNGRQTA